MKNFLLIIFTLTLVSCISGPPKLTHEQILKMTEMEVFKEGEQPSKKYTKLSELSGADCSGAPGGGRVWGVNERAIKILKAKAAAQNADAVINISCGTAPFVNNCWAAKKCDGIAVKWIQ